MVATRIYESVAVGDVLPPLDVGVSRLAVLLYGGQPMRIDFAETHWSERAARERDLPDIILHGSFTLAKTLEIVTAWTGDPAAVAEHSIQLLKPVPVPDDGTGAVLRVTGTVEDMLGSGRVGLALVTSTPDGVAVARTEVVAELPCSP